MELSRGFSLSQKRSNTWNSQSFKEKSRFSTPDLLHETHVPQVQSLPRIKSPPDASTHTEHPFEYPGSSEAEFMVIPPALEDGSIKAEPASQSVSYLPPNHTLPHASISTSSSVVSKQPMPPEDLLLFMRKTYSNSTLKRITPCRVTPKDFVKIRLLGKGDVGKVYLVRRKGTNKLYAMKVLSKQEMTQRNKFHRVLTEHTILSHANHPFLVSMYHCFQTPRNLYFCLEYCLGGEFFRTLQAHPGRCMQENHVRFYAAEVILALEFLHLQGYIYRDLKPGMHCSNSISFFCEGNPFQMFLVQTDSLFFA
jgi:protein-serine/threonine kinase